MIWHFPSHYPATQERMNNKCLFVGGGGWGENQFKFMEIGPIYSLSGYLKTLKQIIFIWCKFWATTQRAIKVALVKGLSQGCTNLVCPSCIKTSNVIIKLGADLFHIAIHHRERKLPFLFIIHPSCYLPSFIFACFKIYPVCNISSRHTSCNSGHHHN